MTAKVLTAEQKLEKELLKNEEIKKKAKESDARIKSIRAKAMHENRKAEDAVKYALGGLALKLINSGDGGIHQWVKKEDGSTGGNALKTSEVIDLLPPAQQAMAKILLTKAKA
jgi:hypothetical protein